MINGYYFQRMHVSEKGRFADEIICVVEPYKTSFPALATFLQETKNRSDIYMRSLQKLSIVDINSLIKKDHEQRCNGLVNLRDYAEVCSSRKNMAWSLAGQLIVNTFRKLDWKMHLASYAKVTTSVDTLLHMLKNEDELKQAVITTQAQEWVAEIEEGQNSYKQHSALRIDKLVVEEAKSNSREASRELGIAIDRLFRFIISEIEFYNKVELKELVVKINMIISTYITLQKQRYTRAKNARADAKS